MPKAIHLLTSPQAQDVSRVTILAATRSTACTCGASQSHFCIREMEMFRVMALYSIPETMPMPPKALILRTAGTNCDVETAHAFELARATAQRVHLNRVLENPRLLGES